MELNLTTSDLDLLAGESGEGARIAMSILVRMAEMQKAEQLIPVTAAHIDSSLYMGDATLDYAEHLAGLGAEVVVPSTLNVAGVDPHGWKHWAVPPEWAEKARRQMVAYQNMGCIPSWTCAPYQTEVRPGLGDQIAWGESSAVVFANSVLGARTERYPDLLDICAAITGRVPFVGLHLTENRAGQVLFRCHDIKYSLLASDELYPVLGHLVGKISGNRVVVLDNLDAEPSEDQLKAFGAAAASSGSVALFHWIGITPEAPSLNDAFQGRDPEEVYDVTMNDLRISRDELSISEGEHIDMVVLGSPHFSLEEFKVLVPFLKDRKRHPDVRFLITTGRGVKLIAQEIGLLDSIHSFGGEVTVDTCILTSPMLPNEIKTLMTNSAKYAYYAPGLLGRAMFFGSTKDCVESAVRGQVVRDDSLWY
jgi:predicted aconitase